MSDEKVPMTLEGKRLIDEELKHLIQVERPKVIAAIEYGRSLGDLSENADYSAAKERQGFVEGRIQEINAKLARAEVIDTENTKSDRIVFGAIVTIEDQDSGTTATYKIVGVDEADLKKQKIGVSSPLARALIGKKTNDEVEVNAPKGKMTYIISSIRYK
jgi:transcription elongation factor GreA